MLTSKCSREFSQGQIAISIAYIYIHTYADIRRIVSGEPRLRYPTARIVIRANQKHGTLLVCKIKYIKLFICIILTIY